MSREFTIITTEKNYDLIRYFIMDYYPYNPIGRCGGKWIFNSNIAVCRAKDGTKEIWFRCKRGKQWETKHLCEALSKAGLIIGWWNK